jgi:hypothetical protein
MEMLLVRQMEMLFERALIVGLCAKLMALCGALGILVEARLVKVDLRY